MARTANNYEIVYAYYDYKGDKQYKDYHICRYTEDDAIKDCIRYQNEDYDIKITEIIRIKTY